MLRHKSQSGRNIALYSFADSFVETSLTVRNHARRLTKFVYCVLAGAIDFFIARTRDYPTITLILAIQPDEYIVGRVGFCGPGPVERSVEIVAFTEILARLVPGIYSNYSPQVARAQEIDRHRLFVGNDI